MAIFFFNSGFIVDFYSSSDCLTFDSLVNSMRGSTSFNYSISNFIRFGLSYFIIRMNQIYYIKFCCLKLFRIKSPFLQLFEEINTHTPIFQGLEVTIKTGSGIISNIVNMYFSTCFSKYSCSR